MPRRFALRSGPSSRAITSTGSWRRMPTAALLRPDANGSPHAPQSGRPRNSILCPENPGRYTPTSAHSSAQVNGNGNDNTITIYARATKLTIDQKHKRKSELRDERELLLTELRATTLVGREDDLASLRQWLAAPHPISVQCLIGRAGAGK